MSKPDDLNRLSPQEILLLAKTITWTPREGRHWTRVASVLAKIESDQLYRAVVAEDGTAYPDAKAFAEDELGLSRAEFFAFAKLGRMMAGTPMVPLATWEQVNRARAMLLAKIATLTDDLPGWVDKALTMKSTREFGRAVARYVDPAAEEFESLRIPVTMRPLLDAAIERAYGHLTGEGALEVDAAPRLEDPDVRFRCLEAILVEYVQPAHVVSLGPLARSDATDDDAEPPLTAAGHFSTIAKPGVLPPLEWDDNDDGSPGVTGETKGGTPS